jgi:uncharacterized membrane protein
MNRATELALPAATGVVAGLRSMTAPAIITWAARRGTLRIAGSSLLSLAVGRASSRALELALAELVADKLAFTPDRINPGPLAWRVLVGGASGAAIATAIHRPAPEGALLGSLGAIAGAFAGYYARKAARRRGSGLAGALVEDAIAISIATAVVWKSSRAE